MSASPTFTEEEIRTRVALLSKCFHEFDVNGDGLIDATELMIVAKAFSPAKDEKDLKQDISVILDYLDSRQMGYIDENEWVTQLFTMFQFMKAAAFERHCNELLAVIHNIKHPDNPIPIDGINKQNSNESSTNSSSISGGAGHGSGSRGDNGAAAGDETRPDKRASEQEESKQAAETQRKGPE